MVKIVLKDSQGYDVKDLTESLRTIRTFPVGFTGNVNGEGCIDISIVKTSNTYTFKFEVPDGFKRKGLMSYYFCKCLIVLLGEEQPFEIRLKLTGDALQLYKGGKNIYETYLNLKSFRTPTYEFDDNEKECTVKFYDSFSDHINELKKMEEKAYQKILAGRWG